MLGGRKAQRGVHPKRSQSGERRHHGLASMPLQAHAGRLSWACRKRRRRRMHVRWGGRHARGCASADAPARRVQGIHGRCLQLLVKGGPGADAVPQRPAGRGAAGLGRAVAPVIQRCCHRLQAGTHSGRGRTWLNRHRWQGARTRRRVQCLFARSASLTQWLLLGKSWSPAHMAARCC